MTHALHYGTAVWEGIRVYEGERGAAVLRLDDHLRRLETSARLYRMALPYDRASLRCATLDVIRANDLTECYVRPLAFRGYGPMGLDGTANPVSVAIVAWHFAGYLQEARDTGARASVSSWRRPAGDALPLLAKASGHYLNAVLAKTEAAAQGVDIAVLLDARGLVTEGTAENIFAVRDGVLITPPRYSDILAGITRDCVLVLAQDLGVPVEERPLARAELTLADELFVTGTAAEVTPVREIDGHRLGVPGPITRSLQAAYDDAVRGRDERHAAWLTPTAP